MRLYYAADMRALEFIKNEGIVPSLFESSVYLTETVGGAFQYYMSRACEVMVILPCEIEGAVELPESNRKPYEGKVWAYEGTIPTEAIDWKEQVFWPNPFYPFKVNLYNFIKS